MRKIICAAVVCLASIVGCSEGGRVNVKTVGQEISLPRMEYSARKMLNDIIAYRKLHGLVKPGCEKKEAIAMTIAAGARDGNPTNTVKAADMLDFYKPILKYNRENYGYIEGMDKYPEAELHLD